MSNRSDVCWAGRYAFFGGRWPRVPCEEPPLHVIAVPGKPDRPEIWLCQRYFDDVYQAGLVDEPFVDRKEYDRRRGVS